MQDDATEFVITTTPVKTKAPGRNGAYDIAINAKVVASAIPAQYAAAFMQGILAAAHEMGFQELDNT